MEQIRIHGRGGQGVVAMAEILAIAFHNNGQITQAFPHFGVERSGAPIQSFVRISNQEISTREHIYEPDFLIILDDSLVGRVNLFIGLKKTTKIIINYSLSQDELLEKINQESKIKVDKKNIFPVKASKIALEVFGKNMVNTIMLGALTTIPGLIKIDSVKRAVQEKFSEKGAEIIEKNFLAIDKIITK
ncbi:MAG TPA: 2-oxoacid:acceptor oxidoreductase family protein [bacterium]|nr:2-oxoacid:acceptor oxidoreductase family protein [bacterium]